MESSKLVRSGLMTAERVAHVGCRAGLRNKLLALSYRFVPRSLVTRVVMNMQKES
jgi:hypothetical protein